ncbi:hypothetical protein M3Y94_00630500 [Aphelenchoides besseyi]|nr:hypothetical protein M3Y94_00630500 [Aphelenchoides besseyi]
MVFIKPSPRPSFTRKPVRVRSFNQLQPELRHLLYDSNSKVTGIFEKIEQQTGIKREHLTYGLLGLLGLYMVVGSLAELVCNLVGLVYPAYASVKAIRTEEKEDDTMWLTYWTVFATFSVVDFWAERIMSFFPFYWLLKVVFLLYLSMPQTRGALELYERVVDPLVTTIDLYIDQHTQ